jgi:hypothetical protein
MGPGIFRARKRGLDPNPKHQVLTIVMLQSITWLRFLMILSRIILI